MHFEDNIAMFKLVRFFVFENMFFEKYLKTQEIC